MQSVGSITLPTTTSASDSVTPSPSMHESSPPAFRAISTSTFSVIPPSKALSAPPSSQLIWFQNITVNSLDKTPWFDPTEMIQGELPLLAKGKYIRKKHELVKYRELIEDTRLARLHENMLPLRIKRLLEDKLGDPQDARPPFSNQTADIESVWFKTVMENDAIQTEFFLMLGKMAQPYGPHHHDLRQSPAFMILRDFFHGSPKTMYLDDDEYKALEKLKRSKIDPSSGYLDGVLSVRLKDASRNIYWVKNEEIQRIRAANDSIDIEQYNEIKNKEIKIICIVPEAIVESLLLVLLDLLYLSHHSDQTDEQKTTISDIMSRVSKFVVARNHARNDAIFS